MLAASLARDVARHVIGVAPPRARRAALVALVALALPAIARAAVDPRLAQRLEPSLAQSVQAIVDSARAAGVPGDPLVTLALEGRARGASADRILAALRRQAGALATAQRALGRDADAEELALGASALLAGAPADSLARLAVVRARGQRAPALVLLGDLASRGVAPADASAAVLAACRAGASARDLVRLGEAVQRDVEQGAGAASSTRLRTRALVTRLAPVRGGAR